VQTHRSSKPPDLCRELDSSSSLVSILRNLVRLSLYTQLALADELTVKISTHQDMST
jgi:hypothetical protein